MKELTILAAVCAVLGLGALAGAGYAMFGGKDVAIERIFAVMVWGLIGMALLGAAQWIARLGPCAKKPSGEAPREETGQPKTA